MLQNTINVELKSRGSRSCASARKARDLARRNHFTTVVNTARTATISTIPNTKTLHLPAHIFVMGDHLDGEANGRQVRADSHDSQTASEYVFLLLWKLRC